MRKTAILFLLTGLACIQVFAYNDHRGHNLDSLERAVACWTPDAIDRASSEDLVELNRSYRDLMLGYSALNGEKCVFYARKALSISEPRGWEEANADACRYLGQCFWAAEQYDSSMVYYRRALSAVERMEAGAVSPTNHDGYSEKEVDDTRAALYGAIGNLYNMMDSIPQAMDWYGKAGAIFDKYGWNQSNAILYYNIGETWVEQGEHRKATQAYEKALVYADGDSLIVAMSQKGLGRVYMEDGKTGKALRYLHAADDYFSAHDKEELTFTKENYEYMAMTLTRQRKMLLVLIAGLVLLIALSTGVLILRQKFLRSRKVQAETAAVMEETLQEIKPASAEDIQLSAREREILDLLTKGYTTPQIAEGLGLSPETIKWYRKKLLVKFDVANTAELTSTAKDQGLI
ncbi:MAG: tetratricopeptide repeat protein [Bacteroidales bacterium]|nr:tetratricopeptide repeat protein [Bacteroidales bacterium]